MNTTEQRQVNGYSIIEQDGKFGLKNTKNEMVLNTIYSNIQFKQEELVIYETVKEVVTAKKKNKKGEEVDNFEEKEISKEVGKRTINVVKCEIITLHKTDKVVYCIENPDKLLFLRRDTYTKNV
jgi:hypothetical protein